MLPRPRLLALELWGIGDLALAMPVLRLASERARVTLLAKPHAAPLLARFAPGVELIPFVAPWTAFQHKYRLWTWPWTELRRVRRELRSRRFEIGVSARADPRDHAVLLAAGCTRRAGFPRRGSRLFLNEGLPPPAPPHRANHWRALAAHLGWKFPESAASAPAPAGTSMRRIVMHTGAAQAARRWPVERFQELAARLRRTG
ncbi:MAG TPA: glycosyltransferase family 9 protein, partial [Opitutaceae bacterium]|nr:glycosyltransferase family 9 protein [Opitutaceae bacterium]